MSFPILTPQADPCQDFLTHISAVCYVVGMDIKQWIVRHADCDTAIGDLARDMVQEPLEGSTLKQLVADARRHGACKEAIGTLRVAAVRAATETHRCGGSCRVT